MDGLEQNYSSSSPVHCPQTRSSLRSNQGQSKSSVSLGGLLKRYPDHPVAAEALFVLGSNQPKYWKQAIAQFPTHPAPWKSFALVETNPNQPQCCCYWQTRLRPTGNYLSARPTGEPICGSVEAGRWEVVGFAYWENQVYPKAGLLMLKHLGHLNIYRTAYGSN